jgi:predicted RecB family nuclease
MRLHDGTIALAPSDLSRHLGCRHATTLALRAARGEGEGPHQGGEYAQLILEKGDLHEAEYLARLQADGREVVAMEQGGSYADMAARTREAMEAGADVIYQATFEIGRWRGHADFLERVPGGTALGAFGYEAVDTKLARNELRPAHVLQLCFYSAGIELVQAAAPAQMHIELGSGRRESLRPRDFDAYFARARSSLERFTDEAPRTVASRCAACDMCGFRYACDAEWREKDDLSYVAGIRRSQSAALEASGVVTLAELADDAVVDRPVALNAPTLSTLHEQAELQVATRSNGKIATRLLPLEQGRGFERLPEPSRLDLAIDLEGDPFWRADRELIFMFGLLARTGEEWAYRAVWAHDEAGERVLAAAVVDAIHLRLREDPAMHVYHYGHVEVAVLKRLCMLYAVREEELDALLRRHVFVDLAQAVRQSLRIGLESYGLKDVERLPEFVRTADVGHGSDAVLAYERYLGTHDASHLREIESYNDEDCRSTVAVLDWLREQAPPGVTWLPLEDGRPGEEEITEPSERELLRDELVEGSDEGSERRLAGELLAYHSRAAKQQWWAYFARREMTQEQLVADSEALAGLKLRQDLDPIPVKRSLAHPLAFPLQEHKVAAGKAMKDQANEANVEIYKVDEDAGLVWVKRAVGSTANLPRAIMPQGPRAMTGHQDALARVAVAVRDDTGEFPALRRLLRNDRPEIKGRRPGAEVQTTDMDELRALARDLDASTLVIQGPPGTGKTYRGARLVTELVRVGKRVGLTAFSHNAIDNLCREIETAAASEGLEFTGTRHGGGGYHDGDRIKAGDGGLYPESSVIAATSWLFAKAEWDGALDYLVIDEAGQFALADAIACGTSARNLIMLGDPSQLSQVVQGSHPPGSDASALAHVLADRQTIPEDRGIFLDESWRMRPDICSFISSEFYEGRLHSHPHCVERSTSAGTGLWLMPVEHLGNSSHSREEVAAIALEIERLLGETITEQGGGERPIAPSDIMVVAPYNAQVRQLRAALHEHVRVGTVDRFQGQEAPIVFFSMATSSGEDAPRDAGFLFSRNRLNVALSRAQSLAILVCSPALLDTYASSVDDMRLLNTLCRFADTAVTHTPESRRSSG